MSKEEKIQEAWIESGYKPNNPDEDGWVDLDLIPDNFHLSQCEARNNGVYTLIRPKSLQGIEDNNGWITTSVENEDFNDYFNCWAFSGIIEYATWNPHQRYFMDAEGVVIKHVSHYQPIQKPKPPIH